MNAIERAADVIFDHIREWGPSVDTRHLARDLADAALLITDEDRAVLDAAEALVQADQYGAVGEYAAANMVLTRAVNARKAAQR